jgi:hypothetical protein
MGRFGVKRTVSLLLHNYWWQGLTKMVKDMVSACTLCSRSNTTFNRPQPQLQPLPISGPGFRWHLDLAGPFPTNSQGLRVCSGGCGGIHQVGGAGAFAQQAA